MVKKLITQIIFSKFFSKISFKIFLNFHNLLYKVISRQASMLSEDGNHPKHNILKYKEWFNENISNDEVILDIGSNKGDLPFLLSKKALYVYGIEISENLFAEAQKRNKYSNVEFLHGDATNFLFKSIRPISSVTMSNVLEHISNRVDFLKNLVANVPWRDISVKRFLIRVPMVNRDWLTIYKKNAGIEWRLDQTHYIEYSMETFKEELQKAGIFVEYSVVKFGEIYAICRAE